MVRLGEALGLGVVAEGVETRAQCAALVDVGCDAVQGFLFGRPGPPEALEALLERGALHVPS